MALSGDARKAPAVTAYRKRREGPDFGLQFYFDKSLPRGYSWAFDADDDTVNIGVGSLTDPPGFEIKQHAMAMAADWPDSSAAIWRGGVIPVWSGKATIWHSDSGVISCGDAAGVADPVTAEGIGQALLTGAWAGQCARDFIEGGRIGALAEYSSQVREHFVGHYRSRGIFGLLAGAA
jgi:menaquinone-9 beta-reductase